MTEKITPEVLNELKEREQHATKGPWTAEPSYPGDPDTPVKTPDGDYISASPDDGVRGGHSYYDAEFISHAREDIPALIAEVERLTAKVERLQSQRETNVVRIDSSDQLRHAATEEVAKLKRRVAFIAERNLMHEGQRDKLAAVIEQACMAIRGAIDGEHMRIDGRAALLGALDALSTAPAAALAHLKAEVLNAVADELGDTQLGTFWEAVAFVRSSADRFKLVEGEARHE